MFRAVAEYVDHKPFVAATVDDEGNESPEEWLPPISVGVFAFDPGSSSEPRAAGHDRVIVEPTIYFPAEVVFSHRDVVVARGRRYEVEGETRLWVHPTRPERRANVVTLRRVDG